MKPSRIVAMRSKPEEHFEPQEIKVGECLLEDARCVWEPIFARRKEKEHTSRGEGCVCGEMRPTEVKEAPRKR